MLTQIYFPFIRTKISKYFLCFCSATPLLNGATSYIKIFSKSNCCKGGLSSRLWSDLAAMGWELLACRAAILHRGSTLRAGSWPQSFPLASVWPRSRPSCPDPAKPPPHPRGASLHLWSAPCCCTLPSPHSNCPTESKHDLTGTLPQLWAEAYPKHNLPPPVTSSFLTFSLSFLKSPSVAVSNTLSHTHCPSHWHWQLCHVHSYQWQNKWLGVLVYVVIVN